MNEWLQKLNALDDPHLLALDVFAEARGEPVDGQIGAAWTVRNRVEHPVWWGRSYKTVILCPDQFSWVMGGGENHEATAAVIDKIPENFLTIARGVIDGTIKTTVDGATNYYSTTMAHPPDWAKRMRFVRQIGRHRFLKP